MIAFEGPDAYGSVSTILRETRESFGEDLRAVAQALRIRFVYLQAIEEGRFDDLPGHTYAVGFVRTYAEYLGLDCDDMVNRFKDEIQGLERRTELVFPTPVPEGKIPGGAVILLSVLLVGVAYGGWLYLSDQGRSVADLIPEVPDRLQSLIGPEVSPSLAESDGTRSTPDQVADVGSVASPAAGGDIPAQSPDQERSEPVFSPAASAMAAPSVSADSETMVGDATSEETTAVSEPLGSGSLALSTSDDDQAGNAQADLANAPEQQAETIGSLADVIAANGAADVSQDAGVTRRARDELPIASEDAVGSAIGTVTGTGQGTRRVNDIPQAPSTAQLALSQAGNPRTYGSDNENARIVLRARHDSWVQVRDGQDELLLTRVLRAGDSYRVPNQRGLTLLTGNAGGLEIEVDGETLAPLGPIGSVRRNIALDPRSLVTGTANP